MALKIPPELKKITQYIRRAEELSKNKQTPETLIVAYHCRQYAVQTGIPLAASPESKKCLGDILTILEEHRSKMGNFSKEEKYKICRDFAFKIFDKADEEDRAGKSNKGTARTFYAAASFLDVLKQFQSEEELGGDDAVEEQKKSFYAKWKSTEILKAIKEGREVKPGGYGEGQDETEEEDTEEKVEEGTEVLQDGSMRNIVPPPPPYPGDSAAFAPPPVAPSEKPPMTFDPPPAVAPSHFNLPMMPVPVPMPDPEPQSDEEPEPPKSTGFMSTIFGGGGNTKKYQKSSLQDAKELTAFALKALDEKDGDLAVERLKQALGCLGHHV